MSKPKSVIKTFYKNGKTNLTYTSEVDKCQYYIWELSRGALSDVCKYIMSRFAEVVINTFKSRAIVVDKNGKEKPNIAQMKKQLYYKVIAGKSTQYPRCLLGMNTKQNTGFNLLWQEVGSSKTPRKGLLTNLVKDNVDTIVEIESKYLSALNNESQVDAMINEEEYNADK